MRRRELPWRRIAWSQRANRALVAVAIACATATCAWRTIDPPARTVVIRPPAGMPDLPAQAFAQRFASAYLTYDSARPGLRAQALRPFVTADDDPQIGFSAPPSGARQVRWTAIAQAYPQADGGLTYVVCADTDHDGLVYLSVQVARRNGTLGIVGYPALTGAPFEGARIPASAGRDVADQRLRTVVSRALGKYLAGAASDLQADLTAQADIALPTQALHLDAITDLAWSASGRSVRATVRATDPHGARMTLAYELDVQRASARWFVSAIQTLPKAH